MIIILDVRFNVRTEPVIFYANSLFSTYINEMLHNLHYAPKARYGSC